MAKRASFVRRGVFDLPIHPQPFMSFRQIFGDRRTAFITEQESMTILPDLEFPTRTGPLTGFGSFRFTLWEKLARAHRATNFFNIPCQTFNENICDAGVWISERTAFFTKFIDKILHLIERFLFWHLESS